MLGHGQQIVSPDQGNAPLPTFYSNAESWSSMPRTAQMAQMVSPPGFGTTVERSTAPVGLDVQRNNNYTPLANSQADNGDSRPTKRRGSSSAGGPVRPKRGRAAVAPYSTTRRKTAPTHGDATTTTANEGPATPSQPPVGQDWNAPWQSGTATKYTASAAKTYLETLPETEWHDGAGFFCPFKDCRKRQSGARYDTYTSLVGHVRRCGPDRECELCKERVARGYQAYEMQRHHKGGNKNGKDPAQPLKKKDNRTPCKITAACGGDDKHEAIYAHLKSKNELDRVDSLQFGDDSDTYSDYLGPRMRRYRSALGEGPSTRRTATTEAERRQSPATKEAEEHDE
ncbi:hypothetical protein EXIGLDRAFT_151021 [Exidia glandulosa HHB12029]|uniref:Uncharacterized protein n=1 Tax=Exidia glandulosa HHB12029 TaxID=1314781 RepID=A0A165FKX2_EXIGL|nr:hypothetical protein EXIGLDRAFT_151021 [Exidia glandulosa HHB12029]